MIAQLVDYEELSKRLGIKVPTLRSMVHRKQIPHLVLGKRIVRFDLADIEVWLAANKRMAS